jgi:hypothetical protein
MNNLQFKQEAALPIADGEWMMIHCDTFIPERERILMSESAFMIDRDLVAVAKILPVEELLNGWNPDSN